MTFSYEHKTHPRARHIKLRVEHDGTVMVTSPKNTPTRLIEKFVQQNEPWIQTQLTKIDLKPKHHTEFKVLIFGKEYKKVVEFLPNSPVGVGVYEQKVVFNPSDPQKSEKEQQALFHKSLDRYLKNTAQHYILERTKQFAAKMNTTYKKITIRKQKTRWGSCSSTGNLNFNWQLVHFPPQIIDYVIVHELSHRTHMNHSSAFWALVNKFCPQYKSQQAWIKKHGYTIE